MYKQIYKILTVMMIFSVMNVFAECSYTDKANLNKIAANVKVDFEIKTEKKTEDDVEYDAHTIYVNIYNLSEELYIEETNEDTKAKTTYTFADSKDGVISHAIEGIDNIGNFSFKVYGSSASACEGDTLKTLYLTTPKYNRFSKTIFCDNNEDFYLCKEFITNKEEITEDMFIERTNKYIEEQIEEGNVVNPNKKWYDTVLDFLDDYKYYFIGGAVIVVGTVVVIRVRKVKKQRELGL